MCLVQLKNSDALGAHQLKKPLYRALHVVIEKHKLQLQAGQQISCELLPSV